MHTRLGHDATKGEQSRPPGGPAPRRALPLRRRRLRAAGPACDPMRLGAAQPTGSSPSIYRAYL